MDDGHAAIARDGSSASLADRWRRSASARPWWTRRATFRATRDTPA